MLPIIVKDLVFIVFATVLMREKALDGRMTLTAISVFGLTFHISVIEQPT